MEQLQTPSELSCVRTSRKSNVVMRLRTSNFAASSSAGRQTWLPNGKLKLAVHGPLVLRRITSSRSKVVAPTHGGT